MEVCKTGHNLWIELSFSLDYISIKEGEYTAVGSTVNNCDSNYGHFVSAKLALTLKCTLANWLTRFLDENWVQRDEWCKLLIQNAAEILSKSLSLEFKAEINFASSGQLQNKLQLCNRRFRRVLFSRVNDTVLKCSGIYVC